MSPSAGSWVCLMYHDVVPGTPHSGGGPERFTVALPAFEGMLDAILELGQIGCSVAAALDLRGRPRVAISFDDGTAGQFNHAVPALRDRGMTATFFVTTDWIGTPGYMTWSELKQLKDWGMSVQSHTKSHPYLSEVDHQRLQFELSRSKAELDDGLKQETTHLALPFGDTPRRRFRGALSESGYTLVANSRWGRNADAAETPNAAVRWIRRCTAPRELTHRLAMRVATGERRLALTRYPRELALNGFRDLVGASRYARWRRRFLDAVARRAPTEQRES